MAVFAKALSAEIEQAWQALDLRPSYELLRGPEIGLVMVRARIGGDGQPFNFAEMTATRCSVRLADGAIGHATIAGRATQHAEIAALLDAALQGEEQARIHQQVVVPLARAQTERRERVLKKSAATKVDFFTLARESA